MCVLFMCHTWTYIVFALPSVSIIRHQFNRWWDSVISAMTEPFLWPWVRFTDPKVISFWPFLPNWFNFLAIGPLLGCSLIPHVQYPFPLFLRKDTFSCFLNVVAAHVMSHLPNKWVSQVREWTIAVALKLWQRCAVEERVRDDCIISSFFLIIPDFLIFSCIRYVCEQSLILLGNSSASPHFS